MVPPKAPPSNTSSRTLPSSFQAVEPPTPRPAPETKPIKPSPSSKAIVDDLTAEAALEIWDELDSHYAEILDDPDLVVRLVERSLRLVASLEREFKTVPLSANNYNFVKHIFRSNGMADTAIPFIRKMYLQNCYCWQKV